MLCHLDSFSIQLMTQTSIFRPGIFGSNRLTSLCGFEKSRIPVLCTVLWKLTTTCETGPHLFADTNVRIVMCCFYSYAYDGSYAVCAETYFCFLNRCTFLWSLYKPSMARRYRGYNRTTALFLQHCSRADSCTNTNSQAV